MRMTLGCVANVLKISTVVARLDVLDRPARSVPASMVMGGCCFPSVNYVPLFLSVGAIVPA